MERLRKMVIENSVDVCCLTELNKDWRMHSYDSTIWAGTKAWRRHRRLQVSQNVTVPPDIRSLVGGTAIACFDDAVFRISEQGNDSRQLGRWSFVTFTGKNDLKTTLINAYCPVISSNPGAVYSQHLVYMSTPRDSIPCQHYLPSLLVLA